MPDVLPYLSAMLLIGATVVGWAFTLVGLPGNWLMVLAAAGYGRCYGVKSRFVLRDLPPILDCGLWSALRKTSHAPTYALLTDIGNDLMQESAFRIAG